jgi:hypothetical protein
MKHDGPPKLIAIENWQSYRDRFGLQPGRSIKSQHIGTALDRNWLFRCRIWGQNHFMIHTYARVSMDGQRREAIRRVNAEKETLGEIARSYNVSRWTNSRLWS